MQKTRAPRLSLGILALMLMSVACRFSPAPDGLTQLEPGFLPLTLVAGQTPSPPAQGRCQVPPAGVALPPLTDRMQVPGELEQFLNGGGQIEQLPQSLVTADLVDLDADGSIDPALTWNMSDTNEGEGMLVVFRCTQARYQLVFTSSGGAEFGPPLVEMAGDLNGVAGDELLVTRPICGAHTCSLQLQVLVWQDERLLDRLQGTADDLPGGYVEVQAGESGSRIVVTSTGINSVGAGPYRAVAREWSWNPAAGQFEVSSQVELPSPYRIHRLHDAEQAADEGRVEEAEAAFRQVATDPALQDWLDPAREQQVLGAYATFKLLVLAGSHGDAVGLEQHMQSLQDSYEGTAAGQAFVAMGQAYAQVFELTGDAGQACLEARGYAAAHAAEILDPLYFGYANPVLTANDLCSVE